MIAILSKLNANFDSFRQKADLFVGKMGLSSLPKICLAVRQKLSHPVSGGAADYNDKDHGAAASIGLESMKHFCYLVIDEDGDNALCYHPNAVDIGRLLNETCAAGISGGMGLNDCMHR